MKLDYSKLTDRQHSAIDEVMDNFDFECVGDYMERTNWGWAKPLPGHEWHTEVPDIREIRFQVRRLLVDTFTRMNEQREEYPTYEGPWYTAAGGVNVFVYNNDTCQVFFSIADWFVENYESE